MMTKEKIIFSISTRRLAESVKGLNSSLALAADNFWPKKGRQIAAVKGLRKEVKNICQRSMSTKIKIIDIVFCHFAFKSPLG